MSNQSKASTGQPVKIHSSHPKKTGAEIPNQDPEVAFYERKDNLELLDSLPALISYVDSKERYCFNNKAYEDWFGVNRESLLGKTVEEVLGAAGYKTVKKHIDKALSGEAVNYEDKIIYKDGGPRYINAHYIPDIDSKGKVSGFFVLVSDITERKDFEEALKNKEEMTGDQNRLFEMVAKGRPLQEILDAICVLIENQEKGLLASLLLLDETGKYLLHGSAPSLPTSYIKAIDGITIGPKAGSCGTAAYKNEMVVVENIAEDPLWKNFRDIPLQHGLRACWSTPIRNAYDEVLGTFALYYSEPRRPSDFELNLIKTATHIAGIAIEQHKANETIKKNEIRYRNICRQLSSIAEETAAATGELFFSSLVRSISSALKVRYAVIGKIKDNSRNKIQTLAVWGNNQLLENFEYSVLGAPCEIVIKNKLPNRNISVFYKDVRKSFPNFSLFSKLGVESYLGVPILVSSETAQGILLIMHDQPMEDSPEIQSLLKTYAVRAQNELERLAIEFTLKEAHDNLLAKVKKQTQDLLSTNEQLQQEITDRKKAEDTIRESEEQIRLITDNLPFFISYIDKNERYRFNNKKYEEWFGISRNDMYGKSMKEALGETYPTAKKYIDQVLSGEKVSFETFLKGKQGQKILIKVNYFPHFGKGGSVKGFFVFAADITEQKKSEEIIKKSLQEKEILLKELNHRSKNNMQIINSLLYMQALNIPEKKYSEMFRDCSNRIKSMSLVHEKIFSAPHLAEIDFHDYIHSLTKDLFNSYGVSQDRVELRIDAQNIPLDIDTGVYLGLIINELVSNALKHAFPCNKKGRIEISFKSLGGNGFELIVTDDGVGFQNEVNIHNSSSLGLKLVKGLVEEQLNGKIEMGPEGKTQFNIRISEKPSDK